MFYNVKIYREWMKSSYLTAGSAEVVCFQFLCGPFEALRRKPMFQRPGPVLWDCKFGTSPGSGV